MSDRHAQGDRAERALRDAFAARAAEPAFAPFDPEQLARAASGATQREQHVGYHLIDGGYCAQ